VIFQIEWAQTSGLEVVGRPTGPGVRDVADKAVLAVICENIVSSWTSADVTEEWDRRLRELDLCPVLIG